MPRKRKEQPSNYDKAFPTAMRTLMGQNGTTQNDLADYLGKTRQAVSYYCDGSSYPDWETIVKIADYFNTSTDYMLGRTDTRSTDVDVQAIVQKTALSEATVQELLGTNLNGHQFLSPLVDDIAGIYFEILSDYILLTATSKNYSSMPKGMSIEKAAHNYAISQELDEYGEIPVTKRDYMRYLTAEIGNAISEGLRKKYIPGYDKEV